MQGCAFWGSADISPHLRCHIPQNHNFGGMNKHVQAKRIKYSNFHNIETNTTTTTTTTASRLSEFVRDYLGEPLPER